MSSPAQEPSPARHAGWIWAALLVAGTFAAYAAVRSFGFIWDDEMHLTQNPCIVGPLGLADVWTSRAARYFPLVLTTFWAEHAAWGLSPAPFHLFNVAVHAACGVALWRVLRRLDVAGALIGASLWTLHPVQVESVAWVTELKNTQSGLFFLLAVLYYTRWVQDGAGWRAGPYLAAVAFSALAMASKSSTVVLPAVLALCAWWVRGRLRLRDAVPLLPFAALSLAAAALSLWTQHLEGANAPEWTRGIAERAADAGWVFWFYLGKLAWPSNLMFIYPRWDLDPARAAVYLPTVALAALAVLLWTRRRSLRALAFCGGYFLVALAPVLGLLDQYFWRYSLVGDHFQYLASMGPLALAGAGLRLGLDRLKRVGPGLRNLAALSLPAVLGFLSARHAPVFASNEALWTDTLARNPSCWMACDNLGASRLEEGRVQEAAELFRRAVAARPKDAGSHINLGSALVQLGRPAEAETQYRLAAGLDASNAAAANGLGDALLRLGRPAEAEPVLREALRLKPDFAEAEVNLGNAASSLGRTAEAAEHYRRACLLDPSNPRAHSNLGATWLSLGRIDDAAAELSRALRIDPRFTPALVNLGNVSLGRGDAAGSVDYYRRALAVDPRLAQAHNNLSAALLRLGLPGEAEDHARQALAIDPGYRDAHINLARALLSLGRTGEADDEMRRAQAGRPGP